MTRRWIRASPVPRRCRDVRFTNADLMATTTLDDEAAGLTPLGSGVLYLGVGSIDGEPVSAVTTQYP